MIARRMADGIAELDLVDAELAILLEALQRYAGDLASRSARLEYEARDRRELSDRVKRGRHANRRTAGELEHEASVLSTRADRAMDMFRVVSGATRPSNMQLPNPSQTEE